MSGRVSSGWLRLFTGGVYSLEAEVSRTVATVRILEGN